MEAEVEPQDILALLSDQFKLYKVYSWNDGSEEIYEVSSSPVSSLEETRKVVDEVGNTEICLEAEDGELAAEMDALGLPLAFSSKKGKIKKKNKSREKRVATVDVHTKADEHGSGDCKEKISNLMDLTSVEEFSEQSAGHGSVENSKIEIYLDRLDGDAIVLDSLNDKRRDQQELEAVDRVPKYHDEFLSLWFKSNSCTTTSHEQCPEESWLGSSWDDYLLDIASSMNDTQPEVAMPEFDGSVTSVDNNDSDILTSSSYGNLEIVSSKIHKTKRRARRYKKSNDEHEVLQAQEMPAEFSASISKYWWQRYLLFSRYDDGIKMDEEGWFSVTPEAIAAHHASFCVDEIVVDCFTGVGGNAIKFAERCRHVIAIDIDPTKIEYASHNAAIYGVEERIDFVTGDFFTLAPDLKADTVFLSPPWGGPNYVKAKAYDIHTMLKPYDGGTLFQVARKISSRVIMFLPKNIELHQLVELSQSCDPPWSLEVEKNYLNGRLKAITAYFSDTTGRSHE